VNAWRETVAGEIAPDAKAGEIDFDLDALFRAQYARIAGVIARVVRDRARAEELAVEVFLKLPRNPKAQRSNTPGQNLEAWLYRTAIRLGLDELRRQTRRLRAQPRPELRRISVGAASESGFRGDSSQPGAAFVSKLVYPAIWKTITIG
jgi:DNA-directed RNA polymerase specialized sigma24 family protein